MLQSGRSNVPFNIFLAIITEKSEEKYSILIKFYCFNSKTVCASDAASFNFKPLIIAHNPPCFVFSEKRSVSTIINYKKLNNNKKGIIKRGGQQLAPFTSPDHYEHIVRVKILLVDFLGDTVRVETLEQVMPGPVK